MKSKKFRDLSNNRIVEVTDQFEDIIILDNKNKIRVNQLLDKRMFEEYVDPQSFFKNDSLINSFAEQIRKLPLDDWKNRVPAEEMGFDKNEFSPATQESAVVMYDPEIEKQELLRKAKEVYGYQNTNDLIQKQRDALRNIIDDDESPRLLSEPINQPNTEIQQQHNTQLIQQETKVNIMDPILEMFKNVKRNTNFKIDFTVENKIPRVDFIEMMEDSYNTSIIDFLAQEFTDDILKDPSIIKEKIKSKLTDLVYPEPEKMKKLND